MKKWRDDVQKAKGGSPSSGNGKKSPNGTASPLPSSTSLNGKIKLNVPPSERDWKKDMVDVAKTHQATRDGCIGLIYNGLCHMSTAAPSEILQKAVAIEAEGFAKLGPESNSGYSTRMRTLYMNLKNKSNPKLRERVLAGEIAPERFIVMTNDELKSAERKLEDEKLMKENLKDGE